MAAANRPIFPPDRDIEDHVCCIIEFPMPEYDEKDQKTHRKKISVQYASINGNGYLDYGELVYGTKGTLALEKEEDLKLLTGSGDEGDGETAVKVSGGGGGPVVGYPVQRPGPQDGGRGGGPVSRGYAEELEHWAWCIRHPAPENKPRCHPRVAMADAIIALTTNLAVRTGQPIRFKPEWFDPEKDDTPEKDLENRRDDVDRSLVDSRADLPVAWSGCESLTSLRGEPSMYLHASDKASGVENFQSAVGSKLIRRELVTKALRQGLSPRHGLEAGALQVCQELEKPLVVGVLGSRPAGASLAGGRESGLHRREGDRRSSPLESGPRHQGPLGGLQD